MKEITRYEAESGEVFKNKESALRDDLSISLIDELKDLIVFECHLSEQSQTSIFETIKNYRSDLFEILQKYKEKYEDIF